MTGRRPKTTRYKLLLTAYKGKDEGRPIKMTIKTSDIKQAMREALHKLEKKGYNRIRLEEAKIGRKVIYRNKDG